MHASQTPRPDRRGLLLGGLALGFLPSAGGERGADVAVPILLLRHAEKSSDDPRDPSLSEQGLARAAALERLLAAVGGARLYSTDYRRTRSTLAPLAERLGVEAELYDPRDLKGLLARLNEGEPGLLRVVVGHSDTTPALAKELGLALAGLDARGYFDDRAYDRLLFVAAARASESEPLRALASLELRYAAQG